MSGTNITLGSNFYAAAGDEGRRQRAAQDSWRGLPGVELLDVQFARDPARLELPGFRRVEKLRQDSTRLTGASGKRKPIVSEVFDVLAREALAAGHDLFAFANADIIVLPAMLATAFACAAAGAKGQAFSRMDFDGATGAEKVMIYPGQDAFVIDARWWLENRWRFRPYIVGEVGWDNVFTAILACHAPGARIHHREPLILHERHPSWWSDGPYAAYNTLLLTLDSFYFRDWSDYRTALDRCLAAGNPGDEARELALQKATFTLRPGWRLRARHLGRVARAIWCEWRARAARGKFGAPPLRSKYPRA